MAGCSGAKAEEISGKYFSVTIPDDMKNIYTVTKESNGIMIAEKISAKAEEGGFAFAVRVYKNPADYVDLELVSCKKTGELTTAKGEVYDVVLVQPREIIYADGKEVEENFNRLYNYAPNIEIKETKGNKYAKGKGLKGEEIYRDVLKKYVKAFTEKWDDENKYKSADMGFMYNTMLQNDVNLMDKIGYAYYDINSDGIDELFIGEIAKGKNKGIVYDIYTIVNRKPTHVLSGGHVDRFFVCDENFICNESSVTKKDSNLNVYALHKNSKSLDADVMYSYNATNKKIGPYFVSYGEQTDWQDISKKDFKNGQKYYTSKYMKFDFIPMSQFK